MASSGTAETLRVVVRVRGPRLDDGWLRIRGDSAESPLPAIVLDDGLGPATFECHSACGPEATQADVYEAARLNTIVENALIGISSTCMAFGRTASGKTYTMQGEVASMQGEVASMQEEHTPETEPAHSSEAPGTANISGHDSETSAANECAAGMMPRLLWSLFDKKRKIEAAGLERVEIVMSYVQVYCEKIHDLLADPSLPDSERGLSIKEDARSRLHVPNATVVPCPALSDALDVLSRGAAARSVAATRANRASSRSHALALIQVARSDATSTRYSQIYLVDLAGSESLDVHDDDARECARVAGRGEAAAKAARISECKSINVSLLALSRVIRSLSERKSHVPVRDSKLTRLLANSLGGNSAACLVVNVSPDVAHSTATIASLRFGRRAMQIQNVITVCERKNPKVIAAEAQKFLAEALALRNDSGALRRQCMELRERVDLISSSLLPRGGNDASAELVTSCHEDRIASDAFTLAARAQWAIAASAFGGEMLARCSIHEPRRAPAEKVKVFARIRPSALDDYHPEGAAALRVSDENTVVIRDRQNNEKSMKLSQCFTADATQADIFEKVGAPLVKSALEGVNGACIVFGQTGSGKTHTMLAPDGLAARIAGALVHPPQTETDDSTTETAQVDVKLSCIELYMNDLRDLFEPPTRVPSGAGRCSLKVYSARHGSTETGALRMPITSQADAVAAITLAARRRATASTNGNSTSSRSHAILTLQVERRTASATSSATLLLVDLAGSESERRVVAEQPFDNERAQRRHEGACINTSLFTLERVVAAVASASRHAPFRESKLTQLLQPALTGQGRTSIVLALRASDSDESRSTLAFGERAARLEVRPLRRGVPTLEVANRQLAAAKAALMAERESLEATRKEQGHLSLCVQQLLATKQPPTQEQMGCVDAPTDVASRGDEETAEGETDDGARVGRAWRELQWRASAERRQERHGSTFQVLPPPLKLSILEYLCSSFAGQTPCKGVSVSHTTRAQRAAPLAIALTRVTCTCRAWHHDAIAGPRAARLWLEPIGELRMAAAALGDGPETLSTDHSQAGEAFRLAVQRFARLRMNRAAKPTAPDGAAAPVGLTLLPPAAC